MDHIEFLKRLVTEEVNSLNLVKNIEASFRENVDFILNPFFTKNSENFKGIFKKDVYSEGLEYRKQVFQFIEEYVKIVSNEFVNDYDTFIEKYGWFSNTVLRERHKITMDELAESLGDLIQNIYFSYMENKFPENYRIPFNEQFLIGVSNE